MKKVVMTSAFLLVAMAAFATIGLADVKKGEKIDGAKEFKAHCAACHPDGGNIVNPKKTLSKKDREANGVKTTKDIVKIMRNPGPGMTKFDKETIVAKEAMAIAEYIIKSFK